MRSTVALCGLLLTLPLMNPSALAHPPSAPIPAVCERKGEVFWEMAENPRMRMAKKNAGGIAGRGVCWWHSRFQRAAWALAEFAPQEPKLTDAEAIDAIESLIAMNRVVTLKGYANLEAFTDNYYSEIQAYLNQWQVRDGIGFKWITGLSGKSMMVGSDHPARKHMDEVYAEFQADHRAGKVTWLKIQSEGIEAHSALLLKMQPTKDRGYTLHVVDSNHPGETHQWYFHGNHPSMKFISDGTVRERTLPYVGFERDLRRIEKARAKYCAGNP